MSKKKTKEVLLQAVPTTYEGLQCWCPVDIDDEKILRDRRIIQGIVSVDKRSLPQNSLWAVWYSQIERWSDGNQTKEEVKCFCKLHFGIELLRNQDAGFKKLYDSKIKRGFEYEEKLELMKLIPVTSQLSKDNGQKYQSAMQKYYSEKGLILEVL